MHSGGRDQQEVFISKMGGYLQTFLVFLKDLLLVDGLGSPSDNLRAIDCIQPVRRQTSCEDGVSHLKENR